MQKHYTSEFENSTKKIRTEYKEARSHIGKKVIFWYNGKINAAKPYMGNIHKEV